MLEGWSVKPLERVGERGKRKVGKGRERTKGWEVYRERRRKEKMRGREREREGKEGRGRGRKGYR